jgi:hypothetical protein
MPSNNEEEVYDYHCVDCSEGLYSDDTCHSDYDGEYRCESCHDSHSYAIEEHDRERRGSDYIHDYGYRPDPCFLSDDGTQSYYVEYIDDRRDVTPLYMGMELEVEEVNDDSLHDGAEFVVSQLNKRGLELVYLKEDGSLDHGFEIVSHPATLGFYMNHFKWEAIGGLRQMGYKAWNARTCGLHIHLSRSAFASDRHLAVFIMFLYRNSEDMVKFAGRSSTYAKWEKTALLNAYYEWDQERLRSRELIPKFVKNRRRNDDRYTAVNLQSRNTIELRFFRPSLRPETVIAALQMCDAVHQYTRDLTQRDMTLNSGLDIRSFRSWLNGKDDRYKVLNERIALRLDPINQ